MKDKSAANLLMLLLVIAGLALVGVVCWYTWNFGPAPSSSHEVWGQFGDYLGGTLNPIFGFLTLVAIVMTLAVQARQLEVSVEQLRLSRVELEASREELRRSAEAQQETASAIRQQARYAALSAKIAAVSSALEAIDQRLNRVRASSAGGLAVRVADPDLPRRRDELESRLQSLISEAEVLSSLAHETHAK
jgi:uncharacterized membrane protein